MPAEDAFDELEEVPSANDEEESEEDAPARDTENENEVEDTEDAKQVEDTEENEGTYLAKEHFPRAGGILSLRSSIYRKY